MTASVSAVSVAKSAQTTITATASSDDFDSIVWFAEDQSIISCLWGAWNGNSLPLTIKGLEAGTTTLYIGLLDEDDNILAETSVSVTVTGSGSADVPTTVPTIGDYSAPSYPGLAQPLPDFGAFISAPLYDSLIMDNDNSGVLRQYYYKLSDLPCDEVTVMLAYANLMAQRGFKPRNIQYSNDDGHPFIFFDSDYYDTVMCTISTCKGVQCLEVFIFNFTSNS